MYKGLDFDQNELTAVMREAYGEIIGFLMTDSFRTVHRELMSLPPNLRPAFVTRVLLDPDELARRGVVVPEGILIQTSAFGDRRPTLFAVKKFLPEKYHGAWENVNWTFNNEYDDEEVSRSQEDAWRPPLPVALQNELMARGADLEAVPVEFGINYGIFARGKAAAGK
jgi:hypothetical protein